MRSQDELYPREPLDELRQDDTLQLDVQVRVDFVYDNDATYIFQSRERSTGLVDDLAP
jgi:hypothetical protein